ncbi:MAG TPA: c-type cytochrome [Steroidobacteraceae bacterium]
MALTLGMPGTSRTAQPPASDEIISRAMTATPDAVRGKGLFQRRCTRCHGQQAWGAAVEKIPALAGQGEFYLVSQLADFLTRDRIGSTMHRAASAPDVADPRAMRDIASYLSAAPVVKDPGHGDGFALETGKRFFETHCAMCHGKHAEGRETEPIPKLAGQHYPYLLSQLKNFAAGHLNQVEQPVIEFAAGLTPAQQAAIADYLSRAEAQPPRN